MALKVFYGDDPSTNVMKIQLQPTWTDNRGNGSALNKLMSTRYPVNALLMELACYCKHTGTKAIVEWAPRSANRQADDLANERTSSFDPSLEVKIDPAAIEWRILPGPRDGTGSRRDLPGSEGFGTVACTNNSSEEEESRATSACS